MEVNTAMKSLFIVLAIQALGSPGASVLAAETGTVNPYQHEAAIGDSATCAPQCSFTFPAVPQGQLLVITHVSAQVGQASLVVLEGNGATLFVTKPYETSGYINAPVTFYFGSGQTPSARIFFPDTTAHTSLIVDLIGHLVPAQ